jgi:hypothetical protein
VYSLIRIEEDQLEGFGRIVEHLGDDGREQVRFAHAGEAEDGEVGTV